MVVVLLADGFEEIEALTPVDVLLRGGLEVITVGVTGKEVTGAHGIKVTADTTVEDFSSGKIDLLILPGGMPGAKNLDESAFSDKIILKTQNDGGRIAAICAAPMILGKRGLLENKRACCYPGFEKFLTGATVSSEGVVTDGPITTARGMGVALDFSLELLSLLKGNELAQKIASAIIKR